MTSLHKSTYSRTGKVDVHWVAVNDCESSELKAHRIKLLEHQIPRRREAVITRKVTGGATAIALDPKDGLYLSRESGRSWGHSCNDAETKRLIRQR